MKRRRPFDPSTFRISGKPFVEIMVCRPVYLASVRCGVFKGMRDERRRADPPTGTSESAGDAARMSRGVRADGCRSASCQVGSCRLNASAACSMARRR